jgi:protein-tyrosine-phosphatase
LIAGKIFPEVGVYTTAGVRAADNLDTHMVAFMQQRGFDLSGITPAKMDSSRESLTEYHVIVGLNQKVLEAVGKIPFRTSALNWKNLDIPDNDDAGAWEALRKNLALHIRELLTLLRGSENM